MTATLLKPVRAALLAALSLCGILRAETTSLTLSGLRNFGPANAPQARVDTISVTLDPATNVLHGKPGQTIGWGFNMSWASNAGDSISFLSSQLTGDLSNISTTGYKDIIGTIKGNSAGKVTAGSTWLAGFTAGTSGVGSLTLSPDALPGRTHEGQLRLTFKVTDHLGAEPRTLKSFVVAIDVTVVVDEPDPVEPADQTITFPAIPDHSIAEGTFTLTASASSNRPVRLLSLQPDICTVEGNLVTIHSAGPCTIMAEQAGNYAWREAPPVTRSFEVLKAPATVTIQGSLDRNYTGSDQTFTATTVPPGLPVTFRYDGDTIPPRDPGIYLVQAFIEDPAYTGTQTVTLTITDNTPPPLSTYATWLQSYFTPAEIQAGAITGYNLSLAGDGFDNLFKYAMGFDPLTPLTADDHASLLRLSGTPEGNSVVFDVPVIAPSDVIFIVQASSNLAANAWQEIARRTGGGPWTGTASVFTGTPNADGTRVPILVTDSTAGQNRRFFRFVVSQPQTGPVAAHVYEFNGNLTDAKGGPSMIGNGTIGATGYTFGLGQGPNVSNALANTGEYSIEMVFRFDQVSGYRSILNFKALASDFAFYCLVGRPYFYNYAGNTTTPSLIANQMHRVIVTRNAATKLTTAYVDGVKTSEIIDANNYYVATGTNGILHFFRDNGSENATGFIDQIRLYDAVLTPAEVTALGAP